MVLSAWTIGWSRVVKGMRLEGDRCHTMYVKPTLVTDYLHEKNIQLLENANTTTVPAMPATVR
jgi:hypothetical protein